MQLKAVMAAVLLVVMSFSASATSKGYNGHAEAERWLVRMKEQGFTESYLRDLLSSVKTQKSILKVMDRPAEKRLTWPEYRDRFVTKKRIRRGVIFWYEHAETLSRAEKEYGVPAEMILAIIGIETYYGRNMGGYRVLDALATLGFDYPRRAEFFQEQLSDLLVLAKQENRSVKSLKGSYAGAMGYGQFIPSSYLNYAQDFDNDGDRDIWGSPDDAIGSVANYFKEHGWEAGKAVVIPAELSQKNQVEKDQINTGLKPDQPVSEWMNQGVKVDTESVSSPAVLLNMGNEQKPDYLLGLNNYYVITRYNRSRLYALAVYELSKALAVAKLAEDKASQQ